MKFRVIILFAFSLLNFVAFAQGYNEQTIVVKDYSGRDLYSKRILIDSNNHLWMTSNTHLIKKVGNSEVYFEYNHPYKKDLGHKIIIKEVESDKLIGFSDYGVFEFLVKEASINWIYITPKNVSFRLENYVKDDKGNIYVNTVSGPFFYYNLQNGLKIEDVSKLIKKEYNQDVVFEYKLVRVLQNNTILIKVEIQNDNIQDLYTYADGKLTKCFENSSFNKNERMFSTNVVENGKLFPKNQSGIYTIENKEFQFKYVPEIESHVFKLPLNLKTALRKIIHFKDNLFVAYSSTELVLFSLNSDLEIVIHKKFEDFNFVREVLVNKNELWVNHFCRVTNIQIKPSLFHNIFLEDNKLSQFRSILETKDANLFAIINGELYKIKDNFTPKKVNYKPINENKGKMAVLYGLKAYNDSAFFAYGWNNRIYKINHKLKTYETYYFPTFGLGVKDVEFIQKNKLLLGTDNGLYELDCQIKEIKQYNFENSDNLKNKNISEIYYDTFKQQLWIATVDNGGLYRKDLLSGNILHYTTESKLNELINNNVNCLLLDPEDKNVLWIGTDQGLQKLNTKTNISQFFLTSNQLKSKIVSITKVEKHLFIGTYDGLIVMGSKNNLIRYDESDGLPSKEFNKKSFFQHSNANIYLGTINGLTFFNPKSLLQNTQEKYNLELMEAYLWDSDKNDFNEDYKNINQRSSFNVSHKKNYLKLKFAVNCLTNTEDIEYQYKLDTSNDNWVSLGNLNTLNLISLGAGNHNLIVQAISPNGTLTNQLKYQINVSQVFYKQSWFLFMLFFLSLSLFYWYYYEKQKKASQQHRISLLKSKALLSQMTPHFINNALNGIQSKIMMSDEITANNYIKSFSNLCKYTLNINASQFIVLREEINYLKEFLSITQIKLDNNLDYKITIKKNLDVNKVYIPTMLLQPMIENSIEHGLLKKKGKKKLRIKIYKKEDKLYVKIKDNGIGRNAALRYQSKEDKDFKRPHALDILEERRQILNSMFKLRLNYNYKDIYTKDVPSGTLVIFSLKICNSDLSKTLIKDHKV